MPAILNKRIETSTPNHRFMLSLSYHLKSVLLSPRFLSSPTARERKSSHGRMPPSSLSPAVRASTGGGGQSGSVAGPRGGGQRGSAMGLAAGMGRPRLRLCTRQGYDRRRLAARAPGCGQMRGPPASLPTKARDGAPPLLAMAGPAGQAKGRIAARCVPPRHRRDQPHGP